jgi:hypothetical protein
MNMDSMSGGVSPIMMMLLLLLLLLWLSADEATIEERNDSWMVMIDAGKCEWSTEAPAISLY